LRGVLVADARGPFTPAIHRAVLVSANDSS
jgi:hypothetical protein